MVAFIARKIEEKAEISIPGGQDKYRAYFVRTDKYRKYQSEVDTILDVDGFAEVIVDR